VSTTTIKARAARPVRCLVLQSSAAPFWRLETDMATKPTLKDQSTVIDKALMQPLFDTVYDGLCAGTTPEAIRTCLGLEGDRVVVVDTVADLRAHARATDQDLVFLTLGALEAGDGGGGVWYWDGASTEVDNLGIVLLPTGHTGAGRRVRKYLERLMPEWFGGNTAQAIKEAVDYLGSKGGGVLYFANGVYHSPYTSPNGNYFGNATTKPTLMTHSNITFKGSGKPGFDANSDALEGGTILKGSLFIGGANNFTIEHMGIDCGKTYCDAENNGDPAEGLICMDRQEGRIMETPDPSVYNFNMFNCSILCHKTGAKTGSGPHDGESDVHALLLENYVGWNINNLDTRFGGAGVVIKSTHGSLTNSFHSGHNKYSVLAKAQQYSDASFNNFSNIIMENFGDTDPDITNDALFNTNGFVIEGADTDVKYITATNLVGRGLRNGIYVFCDASDTAAECVITNAVFSKLRGYIFLTKNKCEYMTLTDVRAVNSRYGFYLQSESRHINVHNCVAQAVLNYSFKNSGEDNVYDTCYSLNAVGGHVHAEGLNSTCDFRDSLITTGTPANDIRIDPGASAIGLETEIVYDAGGEHAQLVIGPRVGAMAVNEYTGILFRMRNSAGGAVSNAPYSPGAEIRAVQSGTGTNTAELELITRLSSTVTRTSIKCLETGTPIFWADRVKPTLTENETIAFYHKANNEIGVICRHRDGVIREGSIITS
jgi:hypothetical protein